MKLKMKTKQPYYAYDHSMPKELQKKAKQLCYAFNHATPEEDTRTLLTSLFGTCHPLTFINPPFTCDYGINIQTTGLTVINANVVILDTSPVTMGENIFIGPNTTITCVNHAIDPIQRAQGVLHSAPITLEDDVWIGANCVVTGGVRIGKGSIIGAGSVVTKDIPSGVIAVGNPCKVQRKVTKADKVDKGEIV